MSPELKECEALALKLSPRDRAELVKRLIASLDVLDEAERERLDQEDYEEQWIEECERRYKAYKEGKIEARPVEEVFRELRSELNEIRSLRQSS